MVEHSTGPLCTEAVDSLLYLRLMRGVVSYRSEWFTDECEGPKLSPFLCILPPVAK